MATNKAVAGVVRGVGARNTCRKFIEFVLDGEPGFRLDTFWRGVAVREGFEPSIRLQTVYSLSRGAPSAARPSHRGALGRIRTSDRLVRSQVLYPAELRVRCADFAKR